ncbi:MAG TPA: hypothetical protein VFB63_30085 [Bryobacteraceae bacterium]|nr:hypothetical protein [Bryobacteraceae bacterium]
MNKLKKPISEAKLLANRANARKSTGPRTPEGKARSARNALTHGLTSSLNHGLTAQDLTALGEDLDLLPSLIQHFTASWNPVTPYELILVKRLAEIQVRRDRCARIETGLLDPNIGLVTSDHSKPTINSAIADAFSAREASFVNLSRYEANLSREFDRTQKQLLAVRKEALPPVDILNLSRQGRVETAAGGSRQDRVKSGGDGDKTDPISLGNKRKPPFETIRTGEHVPPPEPVKKHVELVWIGADGKELEIFRRDREEPLDGQSELRR